MRFRLAAIIAVLTAVGVPSTASASEIIDRNASNVSLKVAGNGQALVSFNARGKRWNVLAWGAVNAIHADDGPPADRVQARLLGRLWDLQARRLEDPQGRLPPLRRPRAAVVRGRLQGGRRLVLGAAVLAEGASQLRPCRPRGKSAVWELRLSHWRGELPQLTVNLNWAYKKFHHIFGSFTYLGKPVHGFKSTPGGIPLDTFGRNLYLDTFNSAYGQGWKRENSFLMHKGTGKFCYGFYSHGSRPGRGRRALPRDDHRPGRHAGHLLGGRRARDVRPGLRSAAARCAEGVPRRRPALQGGLARSRRSSP